MKVLMTVFALGLIAVSAKGAHAAQCKFELQNGRGKVLHTFTGFGYLEQDACKEAKKDCKQVKQAGYFRAPIQQCIKVKELVTRTCSVEMVNKRGKFIKEVSAQATGLQGMGIKAKACKKALKKCEKQKFKQGFRGASCLIINSIGDPQSPVIISKPSHGHNQSSQASNSHKPQHSSSRSSHSSQSKPGQSGKKPSNQGKKPGKK